MSQITYRVEAFIIPVGNDCYNKSVLTKTDDAKITDKFKIKEINDEAFNDESKNVTIETNSLSTEKECLENLCNSLLIENIDANAVPSRTINNQSTLNDLDRCFSLAKSESHRSYGSNSSRQSLNSFRDICTLKPIVEKNEDTDEKLTDLCYHGCKNGCSATVQTPQEVSEEVFKDNWLQRLEIIRQKESAIKNKEMILQSRERALFKREKEVRIMERVLKEKVKKIETYLKQFKRMHCSSKMYSSQEDTTESAPLTRKNKTGSSKDELSIEEFLNTHSCEKLQEHDDKQESMPRKQAQQSDICKNMATSLKETQQDKTNACGSSSSSNSTTSEDRRIKERTSARSFSSYKFHSYANNKAKKPYKPYYEDLDSTLSADVGDSSFVQTSQKFNPELYKKPYAFTRSASERRGKRIDSKNNVHLDVTEEFHCQIEQDRVLRRVAENITASQDKSTKYQHYGLIDRNVEATNKLRRIEDLRDEKYSYLDLETSRKFGHRESKGKSSRDRPQSWNDETNDWLQKKRQVYNTTAKQTRTDLDKENLKLQKPDKVTKKKDIKNKLFTIFR